MSKQELIDKAVHSLDGVYEKSICGGNDVENYLWAIDDNLYQRLNGSLGFSGDFVCTRGEFQQRASELGYINGYRWGVEYPTNGKKPDLPDTILVDVRSNRMKDWHIKGPQEVGGWLWRDLGSDLFFEFFRIVDKRYKPADTSYLDSVSEIPESKSNAENVSSLPKTNFNEGAEHFEWIANQFENVDDINAVWKLRDKLYQNRKAEAEKTRVVDAVQQLVHEFDHCAYVSDELLSFLHDKGYLRTPAN